MYSAIHGYMGYVHNLCVEGVMYQTRGEILRAIAILTTLIIVGSTVLAAVALACIGFII